MAEEKTFTYAEVAEHSTKKDIHVVIHGLVYDVSDFLDEHPGGEEVLLDVAGQDATEAFEDVGHSDEAREILREHKIGVVEKKPGDAAPKTTTASTSSSASSSSGGLGVGLYAFVLIGAAAAYGVYQYLQINAAAEKQ